MGLLHPPPPPKGQLPIRQWEQLLLNQLIKWLAVPGVLSSLIILHCCVHARKNTLPEYMNKHCARAHRHSLCSCWQLGLILPLCLIISGCAALIWIQRWESWCTSLVDVSKLNSGADGSELCLHLVTNFGTLYCSFSLIEKKFEFLNHH